MEGIYNKLERISKPRVHIKYEVETEGKTAVKELPFVVGVMGDFSGDSTESLGTLRDRKFIQINRDNFNEVMRQMKPTLQFNVENSISEEKSEMLVNLTFESMEDFEPAHLVEKIPVLKKLLETRNKLRDLLTKIDRSQELESLLEYILQDAEALQKFHTELGTNHPDAQIDKE